MLKRRILALTVVTLFMLIALVFIVNSKVMAADDAANLSWGRRGTSISQLQQDLIAKGYWCGDVDGIFGSKTHNAVVRFQKNAGVKVDGIVGPHTKQALGITSASGIQGKTISIVATGYDDSYECNYPWYGAPSYTGLPLVRGVVATDPNVIPMGTRLYVEGYGEAIAADQGGAIKGNRIDLFFDSHTEAMNWGMRTVKVTVL